MTSNGSEPRHALIVGVTGITGYSLARHLLESGWQVSGISRTPPKDLPTLTPISVDVTDRASTIAALGGHKPTHVFFCSWLRQDTEAENCRVNGGMLRNVLDALAEHKQSVKHVALTTGLKHYLGPFEAYGTIKPETPFREDQPRLKYENFYYTQEDILFECAERDGFTWSVHRPHSVIGFAVGNAMNMGMTLAVYGTICKETGRPFIFPGSPEQYQAVTDVTDARILARHLQWASTTPAAANQALNIVNGDQFRWRRMWTVVAHALGVEPAEYPGRPTPLETYNVGAAATWKEIAAKYKLAFDDINTLVSWWHTDADLGRTMETFTDMSKSRRLGFLDYQQTDYSFIDLFDELRARKVIPSL